MNLIENNGKIVSMGTGYIEASLMPKFQPKIMFYAVLNWKRVQFLEPHQFWGIW
jgi:hypothetical protein